MDKMILLATHCVINILDLNGYNVKLCLIHTRHFLEFYDISVLCGIIRNISAKEFPHYILLIKRVHGKRSRYSEIRRDMESERS